jgi:hypothetical protein
MHNNCITHGHPPALLLEGSSAVCSSMAKPASQKPAFFSYWKGSDHVWARPAKAEAGRKPRKQDSRTAAKRKVGGWWYGGWMDRHAPDTGSLGAEGGQAKCRNGGGGGEALHDCRLQA